MRQYKEVPPWLAADNTPKCESNPAAMGTGGGCGVQTPDSSGFGEVDLVFGSNFEAAGDIYLTFPSTPPTLFISGAEELGTLTQSTLGNTVTIAYTGAKPIPGVHYKLHYEWETSY